MKSSPDNRLRAIAAMAILRDGDDAAAIADYLHESDRDHLVSLIGLYAQETQAPYRMGQLLRQMALSERFSNLAEVHPAWILEYLREEAPRVIGIILRSLPSKHVRFILKGLPPMVRVQLPDLVESFAVAGPVLEIIRGRFERHFEPMRVSRTGGQMGFEHLYYLRSEELEALIRAVGLTELAIALSGLSGKTLHVVFNRLDLKDAKRLQRRIRELGAVSPELFRQARSTILEVEGERLGPERMLMRVGLAALANAIEGHHASVTRLIMQRLDPADGYLLKRLIDERRARTHAAVAAERQAMILAQAAELACEGRIDAAWGQRFSSDAAGGAQRPIPLPSAEEETKTGRESA